MKPRSTWILVLSATRARILRGLPGADETPPVELLMRARSRRMRKIMDSWPGRKPVSDSLREDDSEFLREIIALLEAHRRAGEYDDIVVIAAPDMLRRLRPELTESLKPLVSREIARDLAKLAEPDLAARLRDELGKS